MPTIHSLEFQLFLILTGIMLFSYWLSYCMGKPLAKTVQDMDASAILFWIPYELAKRKLKQASLWSAVNEQWREQYRQANNVRDKIEALRDHRADVVYGARELFTWERSLLCPVCLHFWLSLFFVQLAYYLHYLRPDVLLLTAFLYLVNHLFIRKI